MLRTLGVLMVGVVLIGSAALPVAAGAKLNTQGGATAPCVGIYLSPPDVVVDPNCKLLPTQQSSSGMTADATLDGTDVNITWILEDAPPVDHFRILRGESPYTMTPLATPDAGQRDYVDDTGPASGETWYQVQAVDGQGTLLAQTPAVHTTLEVSQA